MSNKKEALMDATMRVIAETGFGGFSMKQVTGLAGVGETLVYKHFNTKEQLLHVCFCSYHDLLADFAENYTVEDICARIKQEGREVVFHDIMADYLDLLIRNDYKTVYYFEYRNSLYVSNILEKNKDFYGRHLNAFDRYFDVCEKEFGVVGTEKRHIFWSFVLDSLGMYATRIIRGEIPDTQENREVAVDIIYGGMCAFLDYHSTR